MNTFFQNQEFTDVKNLALGEYEDCIFKGIDFSEVNLSNYKFAESNFEDCNLSLCKISETAFRVVLFKNCKLLGLRFDECNAFGLVLRFENSNLQHTSFFNTDIRKTIFKNCNLTEVDFEESNVSNGKFEECDLRGANFLSTNLENTDFRTSYNYSLEFGCQHDKKRQILFKQHCRSFVQIPHSNYRIKKPSTKS
jgi:uncharacterized protein YjbI with pentapeptide repeats